MGLGGTTKVTLATTREKATAARLLIGDGTNPLEAKHALKAIPTFGEFADDLVTVLSAEWRNDKHKAQWSTTLTKDAAPLRAMRLDRIETADVLATLKPLWSERPETALRLQRRIARVLDAAKAKGLRVGENPARWSGHLDHLLPARQKLTRGHHAGFGRRCEVMPSVGGVFASRQAQRLTYQSQSADQIDRMRDRAHRLQKRLWPDKGKPRPRGRNRERLIDAWERANTAFESMFTATITRRWGHLF